MKPICGQSLGGYLSLWLLSINHNHAAKSWMFPPLTFHSWLLRFLQPWATEYALHGRICMEYFTGIATKPALNGNAMHTTQTWILPSTQEGTNVWLKKTHLLGYKDSGRDIQYNQISRLADNACSHHVHIINWGERKKQFPSWKS